MSWAGSISYWIKCKAGRPVTQSPHVTCHWMPLPQWLLVDQSQCEYFNFLWSQPENLWTMWHAEKGFPGGASVKELAYQCRICKKCGFDPWVQKIPWSRPQQPTPVFLNGESHGQRSLAGVEHYWNKLAHTPCRKRPSTCFSWFLATISACELWNTSGKSP